MSRVDSDNAGSSFTLSVELSLTLRKPALLVVRQLIDAPGTVDARDVFVVLLLLSAYGPTTTVAHYVFRRLQVLAHRDPLVKHKTVALPFRFGWGHSFEILQYSAPQMEHLLKPGFLEQSRRLFAADSAGAKHRHFLVLLRV